MHGTASAEMFRASGGHAAHDMKEALTWRPAMHAGCARENCSGVITSGDATNATVSMSVRGTEEPYTVSTFKQSILAQGSQPG